MEQMDLQTSGPSAEHTKIGFRVPYGQNELSAGDPIPPKVGRTQEANFDNTAWTHIVRTWNAMDSRQKTSIMDLARLAASNIPVDHAKPIPKIAGKAYRFLKLLTEIASPEKEDIDHLRNIEHKQARLNEGRGKVGSFYEAQIKERLRVACKRDKANWFGRRTVSQYRVLQDSQIREDLCMALLLRYFGYTGGQIRFGSVSSDPSIRVTNTNSPNYINSCKVNFPEIFSGLRRTR